LLQVFINLKTDTFNKELCRMHKKPLLHHFSRDQKQEDINFHFQNSYFTHD